MSPIKLLLICLLLETSAFAGAFTSTASGNFSAGATWVGGVAPSAAGDTWTIAAGTDVIYDVDNSGGAGWGASVVTGNLVMTNVPCFLKMNGNLSGAGNWRIGSTNSPVPFVSSNLPCVVIEFTNSVQCTMAGTNNLGWYGDYSHIMTTYLSNACSSAATSIVLSNVPPNVTTNDVLCMGNIGTVGAVTAEYYVVGSVSGTTVTFKSTFGTETNNYPACAFRTSTSSSRGVGTFVSFFSTPVIVRETVARSVSTITASQTNVLSGVLCMHLGKGLATSCSGWTASNNTANNCSNGGLASSSCSGWTASNNTANNCYSGGLASSSCSGWTASNNTANNCYSGGLANGCSGWTASNNTANNCFNGGLASSSCSGWTASNNTANNCSSGGLAYSSCSGWTVSNNTANNCSSGGLASSSCSGWMAYSNTNLGTTAQSFILCDTSIANGWSSSNTHSGYGFGYSPIMFDGSYWLEANGVSYITNVLGLTVVQHVLNTANKTVSSWFPVSARPGVSRTVTAYVYKTNNVAYYGALVPAAGAPTSTNQLSLIAAAAASGGWTSLNFTFTNTNSLPMDGRIWIGAVSASPTIGYSFVQESGDMLTQKQ